MTDTRNKANWEHSRYKNWRPSHAGDGHAGRRGSGGPPPRRRRSLPGRLVRLLAWGLVILVVAGPGGDFANGRLKAAGGSCAVQVVVDGGRVLTGCPDLPQRIAGYDAPALLSPGCLAEARAAVMASLELRKALYAADEIALRGPGPVAAPVAEPEGGTATADPQAAPEDGPDPGPEPGPAPDNAVPAGRVQVLADGTDVAAAMLASGRVQPAGGAGWCE